VIVFVLYFLTRLILLLRNAVLRTMTLFAVVSATAIAPLCYSAPVRTSDTVNYLNRASVLVRAPGTVERRRGGYLSGNREKEGRR
jgi:hypothetical protein